MDKKIFRFIEKQKCATVCCVDEQSNPYCFSCFYGFNSKEGLLYFKSSPTSRHSEIILKNPVVAGTIMPDRLNLLLVKGVQFEGIVLEKYQFIAKQASTFFHKQNPLAITIPGEIWTIQLTNIKMTDNSMGFGKKIYWRREILNAG